MGVIYDMIIREKDENTDQYLVCDWLTINIPKNTPRTIRNKILERWLPTEQETFEWHGNAENMSHAHTHVVHEKKK